MSDGREFWPMATVYVETTLPNGRPVAYFTRVDVQAHDSPEAAMMHALRQRRNGCGIFLGCEVVLTAPHGVTTRRVLDCDWDGFTLRPL